MDEQRQASDRFAPATGIGGRRVLWPVAIGAISVALGAEHALHTVGYILQMIYSFFTGDGSLGSLLSMLGTNSLWGLLRESVQLLTGIMGGALLVPAGLLTWRQNKSGPLVHAIYAIVAIPLIILWPIVQIMSYSEMFRAQFFIIPIWWATVTMIYPVFLLIWFSRPKVKAETRLWR